MKVLIISHQPMTMQNNMGKTFCSLLSEFDAEELCQFYIYPAFPDGKYYTSFYRVTDKEVLRSYLGRRYIGGEVCAEDIRPEQGAYEDESDRAFYRNRKNKSGLRRLLRDCMWQFSPWCGKRLKSWLIKERPECIFVAPGTAKFIYNIALRLSKKYSIPLVTYICDDYYFLNRPRGFANRLQFILLRRKIRQLLENSSHLVVISEELRQAYAGTFGVETTVIMTGTTLSTPLRPAQTELPQKISYFGNVRCNRFRSLAEIGLALDSINRDSDTKYRLCIYTAEKDPEILAELERAESVSLCGFVSGDAFDAAMRDAQILLHAEAFDAASVDTVKYSVSTKIADGLASGLPLFAYGPESIASMQHLIRNECALAVTEPDDLIPALCRIFSNGELRRQIAARAQTTAKELHDRKTNSEKLRRVFEKTIG
ncbi:MAG: glycosyltransferase [Clostridia bacterium]|nr:glycosyltransferase [Clostridia bacterium]